jgi:hypothetical protein
VKKLFLLALATFLSAPVLAASELVQVVGFSWDGTALQFETLGSGTALESNVILTNKHVVQNEGKDVDFILLCPAKKENSQSVQCNIPAGVTSLHPTLDAALIRPLDKDVFFRSVRRITHDPVIGTSLRIEGFPIETEDFAKFGSKKTIEMIQKWLETGGTLEAKGDALTVSRGKIQRIGTLKTETENFGHFFWTDIKANFGNSGGGAFDQLHRFVGMPTLRDQQYNAFVLAITQLEPWIKETKDSLPQPTPVIQEFYEKQLAQKISPSDLMAKSIEPSRAFTKRWRRATTPQKRYKQPIETKEEMFSWVPVLDNKTTVYRQNSQRNIPQHLLQQIYF